MHNTRLYNKTDDAPWAIRRIIKQAVGRMARTAYKRPEILLMCDSDLTQILGEDTSPRETLSHEYAALSDYCKSSLSEPRESLNSSQRRQHNLALFYSLNTLALIDELLRGIFRGDENSIEEWQNLRLQLLRHPTIAETTDDYPQLYLQAPQIPYGFSANLDAQWHQGSNTGRQIKLFDDALTPSMVGESECQLPLMMRNAIVREHFIAEGFATCWAAEPWVMTPGAYQNIYKGGLGEEAIKALLIDSGLILENLPQAVYERFDFIATNQQGLRIAIDAKHWASSGEAHQHEQKIQLLKQHCNVHHFAYINLIGLPNSSIECVDDELKPSKDANHSTLIIPGLIDAQTGATLEAHIAPLLTWKRAPK